MSISKLRIAGILAAAGLLAAVLALAFRAPSDEARIEDAGPGAARNTPVARKAEAEATEGVNPVVPKADAEGVAVDSAPPGNPIATTGASIPSPVPPVATPAVPAVPGGPAKPMRDYDEAGMAAIANDLIQVQLMVIQFRDAVGENPVGTNAEIMRAVMGDNLKQARIGHPEDQQLNGDGELVDRWGTPYFFHQLSKSEMEVRSAGPDRVMWTDDDRQTK